MAKNFRKGFFRLWVVLSLLCLLLFGSLGLIQFFSYLSASNLIANEQAIACVGQPSISPLAKGSDNGKLYHECDFAPDALGPKEDFNRLRKTRSWYEKMWALRDQSLTNAKLFFCLSILPCLASLIIGRSVVWVLEGFK